MIQEIKITEFEQRIKYFEEIANKELVDLYMSWAEKNKTVGDSPAFIGVSSSFSTMFFTLLKERFANANPPQVVLVYFNVAFKVGHYQSQKLISAQTVAR